MGALKQLPTYKEKAYRGYTGYNNIGLEGCAELAKKKRKQKFLSSLQALCWRNMKQYKIDYGLPMVLMDTAERKYNESEFV